MELAENIYQLASRQVCSCAFCGQCIISTANHARRFQREQPAEHRAASIAPTAVQCILIILVFFSLLSASSFTPLYILVAGSWCACACVGHCIEAMPLVFTLDSVMRTLDVSERSSIFLEAFPLAADFLSHPILPSLPPLSLPRSLLFSFSSLPPSPPCLLDRAAAAAPALV